MLIRNGIKERFIGLARCFAGGETVSETLIHDWHKCVGIPLYQEYGLGEGGVTTIADWGSKEASLGKPLPSVVLDLINQDSEGVGEIVVYRPHAPTQYLFGESPETFQTDGGIRTGDLAKFVNGQYYFMGRKKSVIVVAGLKVVPLEIEQAITSITGKEVAVVGWPDPNTGERPVAFIESKDPVNNYDLFHELRKELEGFKVPKDIRVMEHLPRTMSGKIDRNQLKGN
jgi:acyl-CoA synthetase (AMP-forming)/AMP-acid ligase II